MFPLQWSPMLFKNRDALASMIFLSEFPAQSLIRPLMERTSLFYGTTIPRNRITNMSQEGAMKELKDLLEAAKAFELKFDLNIRQYAALLAEKEKIEATIENLKMILKKTRDELYQKQGQAEIVAKEIVEKANYYLEVKTKAADDLAQKTIKESELLQSKNKELMEKEKDLEQREIAVLIREKEVAKIKEALKIY